MWQYMQFNLSKISKIFKTDFFTGIFILVVAYLYVGYLKGTERPEVTTSNGKIKGIVSFSRDYLKYHAYYGIPYAKPPVGNLRFEAPQPPENWRDVRDAGYYRSQCISVEFLFMGGILFGSEDCLYLNVFVPQNRSTIRPLPVMMFIHGGWFHFGSAEDHGEKYFMDEDVILVTLTYRLGALGFLSTGDHVVRGNQGLKDQTMALKWIKQNIHAFGGCPNQITIFGESAGAVAVSLHLLSPLSKGLFHRAISQSGAPTSMWGLMEHPESQAKRFAAKFKCPTVDNAEMISCLKQVDAYNLVYEHNEANDYFRTANMLFVPTVEAFNDSQSFLPGHPKEILRKGDFERVPWILGANSDEGLLLSTPIAVNSTKLALISQFELSLPITLQYQRNDRITHKIQNFYLDKYNHNATHAEFLSNMTHLFGDRYFYYPMTETAKLYSKYAPLYMYHFNFSGFHSIEHFIADRETSVMPHPFLRLGVNHSWRVIQEFLMGIPVLGNGSCHSSELPFMFNHPWTPSFYSKLPERDYQMSKNLVGLWVSFARSRETLTLGKVRWTPVAHNVSLKYLDISKNPSMIQDPFADRVKFWESIADNMKEPF